MSIYTKAGDKGETGLFSSDKSKKIRVSKGSTRIEAIGSIDEANTSLGLAASFVKNKKLKGRIIEAQKHLFEAGAILAGAEIEVDKKVIDQMENEIDEWTVLMPPLKNFIFPGGTKAAAFIFTARSVVRRAERLIVKLNEEKKLDFTILIYINRVSDYLFTLARYVNFREGIREEIWEA